MRIFLLFILLDIFGTYPAVSMTYEARKGLQYNFAQDAAVDSARHARDDCQQKDQQQAACPESACSAMMGGSGSPKEKATNIAQKAAAEAKAASDAQPEAAQLAAQQVKAQLAEKAMQAAKAAEAAMAGKQQMVEQIQNEVKEAEALRQQEERSVQNAQNNLMAAQQATQKANEAIAALNHVICLAKENLQSWEEVTQVTQQELSEKNSHHGAARNRVEQLLKALQAAREDLERTKQAACNAATAAKKAKDNAEARSRRNFNVNKRQTWVHRGHGHLRRMRRRHRRPQNWETDKVEEKAAIEEKAAKYI